MAASWAQRWGVGHDGGKLDAAVAAAGMAVMGQEVAAVAVVVAAAAAIVVGPLPHPSLSSHSRGSSVLSFFK